MKNLKIIKMTIFCFLLSAGKVFADSIDDALKADFSKQETVKIRFEVNKRLFSYEAGKFKIENAKKNRDKIRVITDRIVPWAIMERMNSSEVARVIVYMYHADEAGASYMDAEDLIPLVAQNDIPLKDFILMVQYNKETKKARIPDEIREAFLGYAFSKRWDGVSILAGGRGLILAKLYKLNINKTASLLLKRLPANGAVKTAELPAILENIIGESIREKNAVEIINNLTSSQRSFKQAEKSPQGLKTIQSASSGSDAVIEKIGETVIPMLTVRNEAVDKEEGIIAYYPATVPQGEWRILKKFSLYGAIKPWLGTPYKLGGKTRKGGIDCSGFTRAVLTDNQVGVPQDAVGYSCAQQCKDGSPINRNNVRPGDLVFFSASPDSAKITHVGLITSSGYFTHASLKGVVNDDLNKKWWTQRYVTSRRLFERVTD